MARERLPNRRSAISFSFDWQSLSDHSHSFRATVGFYDRAYRRPGEVFLNAEKLSTDLDVAARDVAILISLALQHGAPVAELSAAVTRGIRGEAQGVAAALLDALEQELRL